MELHHLSPGPQPPETVHAIVEIPQGLSNKYEYDPQHGLFRLDRVLYSAVHYPMDYGFVPSTLSEDGDTLDILVMTTTPTFPGCLIEARPVGLFRMRDEKGQDEKILAAARADPRLHQIERLADVPAHLLREVEHFFSIYKDLEGKKVETLGWEDRDAAYDLIRSSIAAHQQTGQRRA